MEERASIFGNVPTAPKDPMFGLSAAYRADQNPNKVDLGPGAYRDENAKPWVLPSVKRAKEIIFRDPDWNHEYLPIAGLAEYLDASQKLILGPDSPAIKRKRVATVQTLSGTGALSLASRFLSKYFPDSDSKRVHVSSPAYVNHLPILKEAGLETALYPYYDPRTKSLDFEALLQYLKTIPERSIVLLHACAHNPTGVDPTRDQWQQIAAVMKIKQHVPFFDSAYQGYASGDLDADAWAIRHFIHQDFDAVLIAQSFAKNFGMYGERTGCLHIVLQQQTLVEPILSQLQRLQRANVSTPPAFGARIVSFILRDEQLERQWRQDLKTMSGRVIQMRLLLRQELERLGTPGSWRHITDQVGMFCFTGLVASQVDVLRQRHHIYMTNDGRISISGLNPGNVGYTAKAIHAVVSGSKAKL